MWWPRPATAPTTRGSRLRHSVSGTSGSPSYLLKSFGLRTKDCADGVLAESSVMQCFVICRSVSWWCNRACVTLVSLTAEQWTPQANPWTSCEHIKQSSATERSAAPIGQHRHAVLDAAAARRRVMALRPLRARRELKVGQRAGQQAGQHAADVQHEALQKHALVALHLVMTCGAADNARPIAADMATAVHWWELEACMVCGGPHSTSKRRPTMPGQEALGSCATGASQ